jgi:glycosyltransferase involved in cell wall biosynthesis
MNKQTEVSVLVPVFNAEKTIKACVWSILNQSFTNFELLLYLDGCTDATRELVEAFNDERIKIITSNSNSGIVHARNALVQAAKGPFLAWLDADDIALPDRLASQYEFMLVHPQLQVIGSWVEVRNSRHLSKVQWPTDTAVLDAWMFFRNPFAQSSIMLRKTPNLPAYEKDFEYLEDYRLASYFLGNNCVAMYPGYYCSYLEDSEKCRIDKYLKYDFVGKLEKIMADNFAVLGLNPGKNELSLVREFLRNSKKLKVRDYKLVKAFLLSAKKANKEIGKFEASAFNGVVAYQLLRLAKAAPALLAEIGVYFLLRPLDLWHAWRSRIRYHKMY